MAERACSLETGKIYDAKTASKLAQQGVLKNKSQFRCIDEKCQIQLTCTNWGNPTGKNYYFRPSSNKDLHIIGCTEINSNEASSQIKDEIRGAKQTISKNGMIKMTKSINNATSNISESIDLHVEKKSKNNSTGSALENNKSYSRNLYSVATFVDLYHDDALDKDVKNILFNEETLSLNELFIPIDNISEYCKNRIYYGKGTFCEGPNKGMLCIKFNKRSQLHVYSNINAVKNRRHCGKNLKSYLHNKTEVIVYIRGSIIESNNGKEKFMPFNDTVYKDLYFIKSC